MLLICSSTVIGAKEFTKVNKSEFNQLKDGDIVFITYFDGKSYYNSTIQKSSTSWFYCGYAYSSIEEAFKNSDALKVREINGKKYLQDVYSDLFVNRYSTTAVSFWLEDKNEYDITFDHKFLIGEAPITFSPGSLTNTFYLGKADVYKPALVYHVSDASDWIKVVSDQAPIGHGPKDAKKFAYNRTFKSDNWNSIMVPFDIPNYREVFGDVKALKLNLNDFKKDNICFEHCEENDIKANTPYIITGDFKEAPYYIETIPNIPNNQSEITIVGKKLTFHGVNNSNTYMGKTKTENKYILHDGQLYGTDKSDAKLPPYRWYITSPKSNKAKINFSIEDFTTSIQTTKDYNKADGTIFNLAGQKVTTNYKGIVIINGKKVIR